MRGLLLLMAIIYGPNAVSEPNQLRCQSIAKGQAYEQAGDPQQDHFIVEQLEYVNHVQFDGTFANPRDRLYFIYNVVLRNEYERQSWLVVNEVRDNRCLVHTATRLDSMSY